MTNEKRKKYGPKNDLTGQRFGYLEVIRMDHRPEDKRREYMAVCKCHNCGKECWIFPSHIKRGQKNCKCLMGNRKKGKDHCRFNGYEGISGSIWNKIKYGAIRRKLDFSVTIKEVWNLFEAQNRKCALTGLKIDINKKMGTASLDRIDSTKGYIKGNIQWVHRNVNIIKHSCSQEYFVNICRRVVKNKALKEISILSDEQMLSNGLFAKGR